MTKFLEDKMIEQGKYLSTESMSNKLHCHGEKY